MKTSFTKRMLSFLLVICLVIPMAPQITLPARAETQEQASDNDPVIVVAGSDFQADTHELSKANVTELLKSVKTNGRYSNVDGFLFAGDYVKNGNTYSAAGVTALKGAVNGVYNGLADSENAIYVQGNHDPDELVGNPLSTSGAHDTDHYGVYVINEKDYMWAYHYNATSQDTVKNTAAALDSYLDGKLRAGYDRPIFVVSHLPLHYNMRTKNDGDGKYANYIFDVLNDAAASGLNIVFLYGHDHSNGWDDYLGGSAVYLQKRRQYQHCTGKPNGV